MQEKKYKNHQFIACNHKQKTHPTSTPASEASLTVQLQKEMHTDILG